MKKTALLVAMTLQMCTSLQAQEIYWRSGQGLARHHLSILIGADYGTGFGIAYAYRLPGNFPLALGTELSMPFGEDVFDDWKVKINAQTEVWHSNRISMNIKPELILRRYQSDVASLYNIGAGISASLGYYRPHWGAALEAGYDGSFASHIDHRSLRDYYPGITDGWYGSTGGSYMFGLKGHYSFSTWSVGMSAGKVFGQDFEHNPTLPFYFDIALLKSIR